MVITLQTLNLSTNLIRLASKMSSRGRAWGAVCVGISHGRLRKNMEFCKYLIKH